MKITIKILSKCFVFLILSTFFLSSCSESKKSIEKRIEKNEKIITYLETTNYQIDTISGIFSSKHFSFLTGQTKLIEKYGELHLESVHQSPKTNVEYFLYAKLDTIEIIITSGFSEIKFESKNELIEILKNHKEELETKMKSN